MSIAKVERSLQPIRVVDLQRLAELAERDRKGFFSRNPGTAALYRDRPLCVTLAQGAARHFIDGRTGVKDFDVWTFYRAHPDRPFPYRRRGVADFEDPRFGLSPDSPSEYKGSRVDFIGRSIEVRREESAPEAIRRYLRTGHTETARLLAGKAVVGLSPKEYLGVLIWP